MQFSELDPRWLIWEQKRIGIVFRCPCCVSKPEAERVWLTCLFRPDVPTFGSHWDAVSEEQISGPNGEMLQKMHGRWIGYGQIALVTAALGRTGKEDDTDIVTCNKDAWWTCIPLPNNEPPPSFNSISIEPSIDASASGHWHGYIRAGRVTT